MNSTRTLSLETLLSDITQAITMRQKKELFDQIKLFISFSIKAISSFDYPFSSKDEAENQPIKRIMSVPSPNNELQQMQLILQGHTGDQMLANLALALDLSLIEIWKNNSIIVRRERDYDIVSQLYWLSRILIEEIKYKIKPLSKIPDLSFLSGNSNPNSQTLFGKPPKLKSFLFPVKYICIMLPDFWGEDGGGIPYLTTGEKKPLKTTNLKKITQLSRPIDQGQTIPDGHYSFILSPKGGLYAYDHIGDELYHGFHHSSFRAGQPVVCAGSIEFIGGEIISIDNSSGHYRPPAENLLIGCLHLYHQSLLNKDCVITPRNSGDYPNEITCEQLLCDEQYAPIRKDYDMSRQYQALAEHTDPVFLPNGRKII